MLASLLFEEGPMAEAARRLGRTEEGVRRKALVLGLYTPRARRTAISVSHQSQ